MPPFILELREKVAEFAGNPPIWLQQVLVTEYPSGTAIGWHKDRLHYKEIIGVSLLTSAILRVRRQDESGWHRASHPVEPRSVYLLEDNVRMDWQHSIPPVDSLRYSLTFRTFNDDLILP